jgi:formylglycine-generating enzyme required for sulfatase activity
MRTPRRWAIHFLLASVLASTALAAEPSQFTIAAHDFDRSNLRISSRGESYATLHACIWNAGQYPNRADYEIEFPVEADYDLSVLYTAAASRPVDILVDGKQIHTGLASVTGSWNTDHAEWEKQCTVHLAPGKHTITLQRQDCMPHICAWRVESSVAFPAGWKLIRPSIEERRQREAKLVRRQAGLAALELVDIVALRRAVDDLVTQFADDFIGQEEAQSRVADIERRRDEVRRLLEADDELAVRKLGELQKLQRELLMANPLLDFDRLMVVNRSTTSPSLGLPQNWQSNSVLPTSGFDDEIAGLSLAEPEAELTRIYKPKESVFVGDVDLDFDADKLLFSSVGANGRWHIFEVSIDGQRLRQVTPSLYDDVDNYDACYLPDGRIIFSSTRTFCSVACVNGSTRVANLFSMTPDGENVRQLCFDQEHNWCPTITNDGRVLYTRWEYTDTPHTHSRLLFHMNPDGTQQAAVYGSNSYWPNAMFYTRPIPGDPNKLVTIVSGHHGVPRMGELVILDPAQGSHEADGVVQRIPGYGKQVEPLIEDQLVDNSWPKFLHPYPLSDKYFLVACQPSATSLWGIYLVDVFDNIVLVKEQPGRALLEPVPIRTRSRPPVRPDSVDLARDDSVIFMSDVYAGPGLDGIPRGTVKKLRLFTYAYDYPGMGGPQGVVGLEGPWDVRRILGTVAVEEDGSASFRVPANTPISVQPLDEQGKALQVMRSWFTGMPGEVLSCVGCHQHQNAATPNRRTLAAIDKPREITPWFGPARGFSFQREVQPVIDQHCVGCHDGQPRPGAEVTLDLRGTQFINDYDSRYHHGGQDAGKFSVAYTNLQRFVRRPGLESDFHILPPMDFHADTTQLVQMLDKGHYGVQLDEEAWDRLITWIDLNAPYHGSWNTIAGEQRVGPLAQRRREMLKKYARVDVDLEWTGPPVVREKGTGPIYAKHPPGRSGKLDLSPFLGPLSADEAQRRQAAAATETRRSIDLGDGVTLDLVLIPAGEFVMGSADGYADEAPQARVAVEAFWMGQFEITNEQYARFDSQHDSRHEVRHAMQFGVQGWPLNEPQQPVVRISWQQAMAFCDWLNERSDWKFTLPSEAQWEYACRAGTATAFHFGDLDADFSAFANLADLKLRDAVSHPYKKENLPLGDPSKYDDWIPRSDRVHDCQLVSAPVGSFQSNAWGLHDMHGNVWEWTSSAASPYPYRADDSRNAADASEHRIARGGSWRDRPLRARSSMRLSYRPYQRVYNVGFRVASPAPAVRASGE